MSKPGLYLLLIISVLFSSCISTQDLIYLQKKNNSQEDASIAVVESKPYRLQTNDVLSITIKAIDPKLVAIFSPSNEGSAGGKSEAGLYFQ